MLNILICCGGGFSSSAMATKVQKEIEEKGYKSFDNCVSLVSEDWFYEYNTYR